MTTSNQLTNSNSSYTGISHRKSNSANAYCFTRSMRALSFNNCATLNFYFSSLNFENLQQPAFDSQHRRNADSKFELCTGEKAIRMHNIICILISLAIDETLANSKVQN